ncbi:MAG TPA: alpha/beta hydrolase [Candidatus Rubrimentiphilum sp.]|nr:alpha/beta hydrolase [Candidatus Rubrimentiphilum sp.]
MLQVCKMPLTVSSSRARSYAEAKERVERFKALDKDPRILPEAYTQLYDCGERTPLAVVLLHGLTNHPGQFVKLAPLVRDLGANVFVPRLPEQGDRDRMTTRLENLTAKMLLSSATEAVDIACGLGERVCVLGISTSALLCAHFAQHRSDVAHAIAVSPVFALLKIAYPVSRLIGDAMRRLPNAFIWWDPRNKENIMPPTGYPRFSTHALGQCLLIGDGVWDASHAAAFAGGRATIITNERDPAVNNHAADSVGLAWQRYRREFTQAYRFTDLPEDHDIIDPQNATPRTDIVYPVLMQFIRQTMEVPR